MKRLTRYLLPVIILIATILAIGVLGIAGSLLSTLGDAVIGFFLKNWDYTVIILITSIVTSVICAIVEEHGNKKHHSQSRKHVKNSNQHYDAEGNQ